RVSRGQHPPLDLDLDRRTTMWELPVLQSLPRRGISIVFLSLAALCPPLRADSFVQNPSFEVNYEVTFPHYGGIDSWVSVGGSGVNQSDGPFHNPGTPIPDRDRVALKQGSGSLSQDIVGLTTGKRYWIQFFYDARACCPGG